MQRAVAQDQVLDRAYSLSPTEFEVLCKVVLGESLPFASLSVTPQSHDGGIDIEGRLDHDWVAADFGVQAKRNATDNTVGSDRVHRFAGALLDSDYQIGTFITTSSFTGPAVETAERLPVKLVSGRDLSAAMVDRELGVVSTDHSDEFELHDGFWQTLERSDEAIPASEVPLSPNFERMRAVLAAMRETDGTAASLRSWVNQGTFFAGELSDRHTYINANSATALGWARKEPPVGSRDVQRWGLTAAGAEYLDAELGSSRERELRCTAIRSVEVVELVHEQLRTEGELSMNAIDAFLREETTLSGASVDRRGSTVRSWLTELPDVSMERSGHEKRYVYSPA